MNVELAEHLGDAPLLHTTLDSGEKLVIKMKGQHNYKAGEKTYFSTDIIAAMLFDKNGDNLYVD